MSTPRIVFVGDAAVFVAFEERIDPAVNRRVVALAEGIVAARFEGVRDVVPTFRSVAVYFDPAVTDVDALEELLTSLCAKVRDGQTSRRKDRPVITIPVTYGGEAGPDLDDVAAFAGLAPDDVVAIHSSRVYRVFMVGFVPGFAYLAPVDERIAMPRLDTPRTRVPAGSVGIAGVQTGIYPFESPGGWRLIGRTAAKPFDLARPQPFLFSAGDRVQFRRADAAD